MSRSKANRAYYEKNKERLRKERMERYHSTEKEVRAAAKTTVDGALRRLLATARHRASRRGFPTTDVTIDWLLERYAGVCEVTGVDLRVTADAKDPFAPSLDRIDNTKGYTTDNVRITCQIFNLARNVYNDEDLVTMARGLIQTRGK